MRVTTSKSKNSFGIPFFTQGPRVLIERLNQILAALDSLRSVNSADIVSEVTPGGTLHNLRNPVTRSRSQQLLGAFTLYDASTTTGGTTTLKIGITPGLVNLISPTFTSASPSGTLADSPPPLLTITATTYFWLKCVGTFGSPDTYVVTVETSSTSAVPSGTAISGTGFTSYWSIGFVTVSGGGITDVTPQHNGTDWQVESYGSVNEWFR